MGEAVLQVLTGADIVKTAAARSLDPAQLDDAVALYHAAGIAALAAARADHWTTALVEFPEWAAAEKIGANILGPRLDSLVGEGSAAGWWFLRKHPCWRIRLHHADPAAISDLLNELARSGKIRSWRSSPYEPETAAFGGPTMTAIIHTLFCADTTGTLDHLRRPASSIGVKELSLLLMNGLFQAARLDGFERGDVFARVSRLRPPPPNNLDLSNLITDIRAFLSIPDLPDSALFRPGGNAAYAAAWLAAYTQAGGELAEAADAGQLERGPRAILTHVVIFHWNRIGLTADQQGILAHAAAAALLPDRSPVPRAS